MAQDSLPGEQPGQLIALLDRWQASLDLHARYAALDDARYWHVQPWPRHERPQRWIIQLARKRILALRRLVEQRQAEGDRACIEGIEIMGFLATLAGLSSVERFIPLAIPEAERREVLAAKPEQLDAQATADSARTTSRRSGDAAARTGEQRRTAETTRQMPVLPNSKAEKLLAAQRTVAAAAPKREAKRDPVRPATIKPKKAAGVTQAEHVVIADAVRLLGWGRQWHELADMIARLAERPAPSEIRRILRTYRAHVDAVVSRRRD
ncbi:MAG TPA: hypothetical protein VGQ27_12250 [Steroidobacteraceae bacterium]|jgi:hypothetical protein|nr:hypothetical protein [Steroidobacteraceae bacterium]